MSKYSSKICVSKNTKENNRKVYALVFHLFLSATCVKGIDIKKVNELKTIEVDGVKNILGGSPPRWTF